MSEKRRRSANTRSKTAKGKTTRFSRRVTITAIILVLLIGGAVAVIQSSVNTSVSESVAAITPEVEISAQSVADIDDDPRNELAVEKEPVAVQPAVDLPVAPEVGSLAPSIALQDIHGELITVSEIAGKPMFISFFHSW